VTYPPEYGSMDPMNRAKTYAAARCGICGCASDLKRVGMEFTCRGMHHYKDWDLILEQWCENAEPAA
jgi:hypothetical protein